MVKLTDLDGVASGRAENLEDAGYESVEDVANGDHEIMGEVVNYLPEDTALSIVVQAQDMLAEEEDESSESDETTFDGDASITEAISEAAEETSDSLDGEEEALDEELDESDEEVAEAEPSEETETETSDEIVFELTLETPMQYDTLYDCVMDQRATLIRTNRDGVDKFSEVLDIIREASYGETVELSMDEGTLNDLHNSVRKKSVSYKGDNLIEHMNAVNKILEQVNIAREENLF